MTLITLTIDTDTHAVVPKVATRAMIVAAKWDEYAESSSALVPAEEWQVRETWDYFLSAAPPTPSGWQPMSRDGIVELVKEAMLFCWNDFCVDTGNHPSDIEQHPRRCLSFHPSYWAEHTGQYVADRLTSRPPEQTP